MIILGTEELKQAESVLKQSFPESIKVYGCIFNINRGKPHNLEVIADQWPDFTVIMCKPKVQGTKDREGDFNIYSIYSKSKDSLKNFLNTPGVINKDAFTLLAGVDIRHLEAVQEFADQHGLPWKVQGVMKVLLLQDEGQLQLKESSAGLRFAPLSAAHAHLVNSTWKYGGDHNSYNSVLNYISHNPSLCVIEEGGTEPISWLLVYQHAALGLLYTLPQHRRKGYAKALVSMMAKNLLERGHPVYCFVEEENDSSYKLFTSLLFQSSPDYRAVWFELNKRQYMQI
ncbi:glycine N-acyltransferase-like protein 3 isoform X1 [Sinocyclocheilus rhinocerous]|uniref:Glycine N-acyltransferase-like protein n=2 Tax=Sinocyclocheilus rhinocerous TaxID=307959 RepID=A0A673H0N9_9TELE|nr:PREDICTED: glycine N-acyltransferase-like protein 3 isoform X1 [Sinocyclocheilus rhinocerous]